MVRRRPRPQSTASELSLNSDKLWEIWILQDPKKTFRLETAAQQYPCVSFAKPHGNPDAIRGSIFVLSVMEGL
jgi:hypothetical protein